MKTSKETILKVLNERANKSYSFIDKFAEILADNINDYVKDGRTVKEWFDEYKNGGLSSGFVPQFIYNSDTRKIFENHYKDLFVWLDDYQTYMGEEFSLCELNDSGYMPINMTEMAFDWFVDSLSDDIDRLND